MSKGDATGVNAKAQAHGVPPSEEMPTAFSNAVAGLGIAACFCGPETPASAWAHQPLDSLSRRERQEAGSVLRFHLNGWTRKGPIALRSTPTQVKRVFRAL